MDNSYITFAFLGILVYLLYKQYNQPIQEKLTVATLPPDTQNTISTYVIDTYSTDVDALRTLANLSSYIIKDNKLVIPGNIRIVGKFNLIPMKMIALWNGPTPPEGWLFCDGTNNTPDLKNNSLGTVKLIIKK